MKLVNYYEDISKPHVNTLDDRAYFIPFAAAEKALTAVREESERMLLLNGSWKFTLYPCIEDVPQEFCAADYNYYDMGNIDVPGCWQTQGYDHYHYVGAQHIIPVDPPHVPADNPCGAYLTDFEYHADGNPIAELVFEGVDSCFYVWVNGTFIGYSESSHAISIFDISDAVKEGTNRLAVLNLKWCTGTYFEIQDKWRMTGIFRDVYILKRPQLRLKDFYTRQCISDDYQKAVLYTDIVTEGENGQNSEFELELLDPEGNIAAQAKVNAASAKDTGLTVDAPALWTAETPALYTLLIRLPGEVIAQKIGFRVITVENGVIKVNGNRIRLKGMNRHDTDAKTAYAVDREHIIRDLCLMKQNNINAIRTAHYQNSPLVIELCNEYGFYVMSEADFETHGIASYRGHKAPVPEGERQAQGGYRRYCPVFNDDPAYEIIGMDRICKNPKRDKNQPSVIFWSLGNESGWGNVQELSAKWIREYDPTRLIHYENLFPSFDRKPDYSSLDVLSCMYASVDWIREKYGDQDGFDGLDELGAHTDEYTDQYYKEHMQTMPFLQCEYIHAMGNSSGDAEDYFELMEKYERFVGGFVWEWADHAKYIGDDKYGNPMYQYGGDSGEYPTDGNFCMDGMNFPDRRPHSSLKEYKNVLRPVRASWKTVNRTIELKNMLNVRNLKDAVKICWELSQNGSVICGGELETPCCQPWEKTEVQLPCEVPEDGECYLRLIYKQKQSDRTVPEDFELGFDQLKLDTAVPEKAVMFAPACAAAPLWAQEFDRVYVFKGVSDKGEFEYVFDKKKGTFREWKINRRQLLDAPIEYNISRAPTDNDRGFGMVYEDWKEQGYYNAVTRVYETGLEVKEDHAAVTVSFGMAGIARGVILRAEAVWTVCADGMIRFDCHVERDTDFLYMPRFGLRLFLKKEASEVDYFGYGPHECYVDKHHSCYKEWFRTNVDELFEDYERPQENGNHYGTTYLHVGGEKGTNIQVVPQEGTFEFNVSRYTQETLAATGHNYELLPSNSIVVCLDYMQSGVGSNSCGPVLISRYRLDDAAFRFAIDILPEYK